MTVNVERFHDPRYSRPRYRLRYSERQTFLTDGFTCGSYKFKRDAEKRADEINMGAFAAQAKRDGRYSFQIERGHADGAFYQRVRVRFCGDSIGTRASMVTAYQLAGEHIADRCLVEKDNPNRRPTED